MNDLAPDDNPAIRFRGRRVENISNSGCVGGERNRRGQVARALAEGGRARVMEADCDPAQLLDLTVRAVRAAAFTGKGDKEVVVAMLERFAWIVESAGVRAVQAAAAARGLELSVDPRVLHALVREQTARDAAARGDEGGEGGGVELLVNHQTMATVDLRARTDLDIKENSCFSRTLQVPEAGAAAVDAPS